MKDAFALTIGQGLNVVGEFYVSLAYQPMLKSDLPIAVYPLQHFMQWGTPGDVAEYNSWSATFRAMLASDSVSSPPTGSVIIPMAGLGQRFVIEGYSVTKPLIPVSGKPMVTQACGDLPTVHHHAFVLRSDMLEYESITQELHRLYPDAVVGTVPVVTKGQACTALLGLEALEQSIGVVPSPITIGSCDNGALFDTEALQQLIYNPEVDVIVWGVRGHANAIRHPKMYGWINAERGLIKTISVKTPLNSPETDPIVIGCFTFRRPEDFRGVVDNLIAPAKINGQEPYTWLRHVLEQLPHAQSVADYEALLPWNYSPEISRQT